MPLTSAPLDWPAIRLEFIQGVMTYDDLAVKHGVKPGTVRQRGARGDWMGARNALSQDVTARSTTQTVVRRADQLAELSAADLTMSRALRGLVGQTMQRAAKPGAVPLSPTELRSLAGVLESAQKIGRLALGVSTENHGHGGANGEGPVPLVSLTAEQHAAEVLRRLAEI